MKFFTLPVLIALPFVTAAQITGTLTTTSNEPIPFANVLLLSPADSALVKGAQTSENGTYTLTNVQPGQYILRFTAMGYTTYNTAPFAITTQPHHTGTHKLAEHTQQLQEVTVRGDKPLYQQEADRTIINVESSILSQGSSAMQVLERSPGITRDPRTNSLTLNGKSNVSVMLNGKLIRVPADQVAALLNGMNANDIQQIEILTTPPSRYDAEGDAGMVNIITKKHNTAGTHATLSATGGYGWKEKGAGSLNLAHNTGPLHTYASYAYLHDHTTGGWHATSTQNMPALGGDISVDFQNNEKAIANSHNANLGFELVYPKTTAGTSFTYAASHTNRHIVNAGQYTIQRDSVLPMIARIDGGRQWQNIIASLYVEQQLRENEKLAFDADYLTFTNENPTRINTTFFDPYGNEILPTGEIFANRQRSIAHAPIHVGVIKTDYSRRLSNGIQVEAGIKTTFTGSTSEATIQTWQNEQWVSTSRTENNIRMKESIAAAYASLQWQITPSLNLQAGTRYEYSRTQLIATKPENAVDRKTGKLFPTLFLTRKINDQGEFQFAYSRRISRPSYNDLGSYLIYNDPMSVETGNPTLRPTLSDNIKVGYTYSGYGLSLLATHDSYPIVRYQLSESPARDLMYVAPQNLAWQNSVSLQTTLPFKPLAWYTMNVTATGSLRQFKLNHTEEKLEKSYLTWSLNSSHTITLPQRYYLELSGWYNAGQYDGSKRLQAFGTVNAGLKKELGTRGGALQLTVTDIFKSIRYTNNYGTLTREAFDIKSHVVYRPESARAQIVKLTYTITLGKTSTTRRSHVNDTKDESERIRKD